MGVESEIGKARPSGSCCRWSRAEQNVAGTDRSDAPGRRVLVVDDNETNCRSALAGQLMHAGYEVSLAAATRRCA